MNKKFWSSGFYVALTIVLIVLLKTVDVAPIGPENTEIGLSNLNGFLHNLIGEHMALYKITGILGGIAFALVGLEVLIGIAQLATRKSLKKVDFEIYALGGLYVVLGIIIIFFEKVIINYRPIIEPGNLHPEASFPSTHTLLACTIFGSAVILTKYYKTGVISRLLNIICPILMVAIVVGRFISGVHWFTDILGGIFISMALLDLFDGIVGTVRKNKRIKKRQREHL